MENNGRSGIGFLGLLTLIFITLKLTNFIDWSWWWVLLPLYGPIALGIFIILIVFIKVFVETVYKQWRKAPKEKRK